MRLQQRQLHTTFSKRTVLGKMARYGKTGRNLENSHCLLKKTSNDVIRRSSVQKAPLEVEQSCGWKKNTIQASPSAAHYEILSFAVLCREQLKQDLCESSTHPQVIASCCCVKSSSSTTISTTGTGATCPQKRFHMSQKAS